MKGSDLHAMLFVTSLFPFYQLNSSQDVPKITGSSKVKYLEVTVNIIINDGLNCVPDVVKEEKFDMISQCLL